MMNRSKLTIAFYLLLVFVSGAVVGAVGDNVYYARVKAAVRLSPEEYRQKYVEEIRSTVMLDDAQVAQLGQILNRTEDRYKEIKSRFRPEMKAIHESQVSAIRAMLRPEQLSKYDQFLAERERERQKGKGKGKH
jgi:hypothetical protein